MASHARSLDQFLVEQAREERREDLRARGLTEQEIRLLEEDNGDEEEQMRDRYGAHPDASKHRMLAIKQKLAEHQEAADTCLSSNISKAVDKVILDSLNTSAVSHQTEKNKAEGIELGVGQVQFEGVPLLPIEVIKRHRLSLQEIKALPRFSGYDLGKPSKVLYVKNIHRLTTRDDLMTIFGHFREKEGGISVRLMTGGRMRGQAFIELPTISAATQALELANGYLVHGQPLVITYSRGS